jgi:large subunit ribosomal protein L22
MSETPETPGPETPGPEPAEKPARRRGRAVSSDAAEAAAAQDAPKPRRIRAKKADEGAAAEAPKSRRTRAAAKPADDEPVAEEAPKPRRTRARAAKPAAEDAAEAVAEVPPKSARAPAKPPAAKPTKKPELVRGRRSQPTTLAPPLVYAHARYVRSSARKARLVCDHIRGKSVPEARAILAFAPRGVAKDWAKLLDSAVANAEHNHELIGDELRIKEVSADVGPTLKRFRPRAMGRATPINKRTAHLSITLTPKE